mmetsp:Transcript_4943/g.8817  ORF Transcript_4943/g.8817 Transcript_4943/m.8817 type:complete len:486 (+) Transcript_4943:111-1568(+)
MPVQVQVVEVDGVGKVPSDIAATLEKLKGSEKTAREVLVSDEFAQAMDEADPLASFRKEFYFPKTSEKERVQSTEPVKQSTVLGGSNEKHTTYLCGNSLGLQPKAAREYLLEEMDNWATLGVEGHFCKTSQNPWVSFNEVCLREMATVVGAKESEVVTMSSLTVNLHVMMMSFYVPKGKRCKILIEDKAFPSDYMAARSQIEAKGLNPDECLLIVSPREGEDVIRSEDIEAMVSAEKDNLALVLLPGIQYYSGQVFEMERLTKAIHRITGGECRVGWDLAHAVGNVELQLHDWGADFAAWCTYKYLNSGPGGIGGAFVHERHHNNEDIPRLTGWWGHRKEDRFVMAPEFIPCPGAFGWQMSNTPVMLMATLRASLELFDKATMPALRKKSISLTRYLEVLLNLEIPEEKCKSITPGFDQVEQRGAQLSLVFSAPVKEVHHAVERAGVICDMREPNVMRIAPAPIYNSFSDVLSFVRILKLVLAPQ